MAPTDSIAVFAEGTFEEQVQELVNYIGRNTAEEEGAAFIRPFQDALKVEEGQKPLADDEEKRRKVLGLVLKEVKSFGEGSEKEIEGFFNLLFAHLLSLYPSDSPESKQAISRLLQTILSAPAEQTPVKYRILSNLFNAIPRASSSRLHVYNTLLQIASLNDGLDLLQLSRADVGQWTNEWDITPEEKSAFLKAIVDAYTKFGDLTTAYQYSLLYVRSLPPTSDAAKAAALDAIAAALRLPSVFNFDALFKLDAVTALKDHELFSLLSIFLNDGLTEFNSWAASHSSALGTYNLDRAQLDRKIRLLTLASLGFKHVGRGVPYATVADTIQVPPSEVEKWVIDVIRVGLITGKLSQITQTVQITRSTARTFEREQWEVLEKRLLAWKAGLSDVLEVVANARRQGGEAPPPAITVV